MPARFQLPGTTVFITGPARGIGAETACQLARKGANLALAGLEPERLQDVATSIGSDRAVWFETDVRDRAAVEKAVAGTVERFGGIDVVVANAGVAAVGTIERIDPDDFERTIDVNLLGVWRTVRAALPHVVERRGHVLCVASMAAAIHLPLMAPYAAAKAGVSAFADVLRTEIAPNGATVGCAYFSFIDTDMTRAALSEEEVVRVERRADRVFRPRPMPVHLAGRALVRGIERRSRWVVRPRFQAGALIAPAPVQLAVDAGLRRLGIVEELRRR
jgi:NAD(P)-dependent dehydrogenase (short-subunit alcohol dehydrogenase family)